ncbi:MAG: hypothetical protein WD793_09070 [Steroidobacteraceae bacterium]
MTFLFRDTDPPGWLRWAFRLLALGIGALHTVVAIRSQSMNEDGIGYLDLGQAWWQGDWNSALNITWSPLYAWIVGGVVELTQPSVWWEFPVVQICNFFIYALALLAFEYFWRQLTRAYVTPAAGQGAEARFPPAVWLAIGYSLFIWVSLNLIAVWAVTPDMCVAALLYLAAGLLLKTSADNARASTPVLFGFTLGLAYLAKSAMFPLGIVGLALTALIPGAAGTRLARFGRALIGFLIVAGPVVYLTSISVGHPSFGEVGRFTYMKHVNGLSWPQWQQAAGIQGTPVHPPRRIHDHPAAWEFATPIGGTYPLAYDPAWWTQGLEPTVALRPQLQAIVDNKVYYFELFVRQQGGFLAVLALLSVLAWPRWRREPRFDAPLALAAWSLAALGLYVLVYAESRYVAPFVLLLWAGLLAQLRLPAGEWQQRTVAAGGVILALVVWFNIAALNLEGLGGMLGYASQRHGPVAASTVTRDLSDGGDKTRQPAIAEALRADFGLEPGTRVAFIGYSYSAYWARLARLRIIAEVRPEESGEFWSASAAVRTEVLAAFAAAGAEAVVAEPAGMDVEAEGWEPIAATGYLVKRLQ